MQACRSTITLLLALLFAAGCEPRADQALPQTENPWYQQGEATLRDALKRPFPDSKARNVILFIGDGMDISTITAARILEGQQRGAPGEENILSFERFPYTGLAKIYNTNQQTPDSAGTATAMLSGVKTRAGVIGLMETPLRGDCAASRGQEAVSLFELAEHGGLATGIVTTARITHATPAAAYAHSPDRDWEADSDLPAAQSDCPDIARQLVEFAAGDGIDVIFAGGRRSFLPAAVPGPEPGDEPGDRADGRNLIDNWRTGKKGRHYLWNRRQFDALGSKPPQQVLGLFHMDHMEYEVDRHLDPGGAPSLSEMTARAISLLQRHHRGYTLLVEAGRIDHGHHDGNAYRALTETIALAEAVATAAAMTSERDTLIVVTADHGHTLRIGGYPTRGNPILGLVIENDASGVARSDAERDLNGKPYTTLGYLNGPGYHGATFEQPAGPKRWRHEGKGAGPELPGRADLSGVDTVNPSYLQEAGIPTVGDDADLSETHSAGDVPIYALGPGAHLLTGVHEQNYIFHVLRHVQDL